MWRIVAMVVLLAPATLLSAGPVEEKGSWYVITFSGTPVGLGRDRWVRDNAGRYYEYHVDIEVSRMGTPVRMLVRTEEWDDPQGSMIRYRTETTLGGTRMRMFGERKGDSLIVLTEGQDFTQKKSLPWEKDARSSAELEGYIAEQLKAGKGAFSARAFDPLAASFVSSRYEVVDTLNETSTTGEERLLVVEQFDNGAQTPTATLWFDSNYETFRTTIRQMGMEVVVERIDADEIAHLELNPNFDVIRGSMIRCAGFPEPVEELSDVVFRMTFDQPLIDVEGFCGPNQSVVAKEGAIVDVLVSRSVVDDEVLSDTNPGRYLRSDRYIQSEHARVVAVADSLAGTVDGGGLPLARVVAAWVNEYIIDKSFGQGFASALDVLSTREGDCTEHAVLTAAVLRAAGIPTRVVVGLAYGDGHLFGHMWNEVYVDRWRTIDALDPTTNPTRIRLAASPDERAIDKFDVIRAYSLVGGLKVEVESYKKMQ